MSLNIMLPVRSLSLSKLVTVKVVSAFALGSLVTLTACSQPAQEDATVDVSNETAGETIRIATEGAYPPFNYTKSDGNLAGFDVDVANALCEQMQANCDIIAQDWDGIIPGLKANKFDAVVAGMSITPERQEAVDFTEPYFTNTMVWLAKNDGSFNVDNITNYTLGGQRSTTLGTYLQEHYDGQKGNRVNLYDNYENAYLDLKSGRLDAVLAEKVAAAAWLPTNPSFGMIGDEIDNNDNIAIAVRKNDPLKEQFDNAIAAIQSNGTLARLEQENFGVSRTVANPSVSGQEAKEILQPDASATVNYVDPDPVSVDKVVVVEGQGEHIDGAKVVQAEEGL